MTYSVRPAKFEDQPAVSHLLGGVGWTARSKEGWEWLFRQNPSLKNQLADAPIGWVVEGDDGLHGYLANIHLDYAMAGRDIKAVTCSSYYITEEARSLGFKIMGDFFRQKNVEFFMSTTANSFSAPVYRMFKAASPVDPSFRKIFFWFADNQQLIRDVCRAKKFIPDFLDASAPLLAPILTAAGKTLGHSKPETHDFDGEVRRLSVDEIGPEFDALWQEHKSVNALKLCRNAAMLRWYMSDPDQNSPISLFAAYDKNGLAGYAIGGRHQPNENSIAQYKIMDIITRKNGRDACAALVSGLGQQAKREKAGLLVASRIGQELAHCLEDLKPWSVNLEEYAHFARSTDKVLLKHAMESGGWSASGLDGDGLFSLLSENKDDSLFSQQEHPLKRLA